jgi:hypothetical protein
MLSSIEIKFAQIWTGMETGIILTSEYAFYPKRRFRSDFAHINSKVLIDIQGGVWMKGKSKHSSGVGISRDCEKLFLASSSGYITFYLTAGMVDEAHLSIIASTIKDRISTGVRTCP